ncbi:(2Fe-2S)-binding protein [Gimibacter soli]|uniref:(2Fe-2S)-binding protein n=1 Tax=Gimibacter soli TaxID=3024400 RepID=A0AAE9XVB4_9PROT|nr:(2Fe-2S)-binding protein [Gimibacter soli]WCL53529.1 (2Fe-2S)-binding protein [Gimibacter soli]
MTRVSLTINGQPRQFDGDGEMPLLWHLREGAGLKGTKFGCGIGACGACTVHIDGTAARSCSVPMSTLEGANITTIEGLAEGARLHAVQEAWIAEDVAQCGYCQAGQIMAVAAFLKDYPEPTDQDIAENITNLCRCGTYVRVRKAIKRAAKSLQPA